MKAIIDGKTYNTETATELFTNGTYYTANFSDWYNTYYITKKGVFFMHYWGGATTRYAKSSNNGRSRSDGSGIRVVTKEDVIKALNTDSYSISEEVVKHLEIEEA